jgi:hypothetical protein
MTRRLTLSVLAMRPNDFMREGRVFGVITAKLSCAPRVRLVQGDRRMMSTRAPAPRA